MDKKQCNSCGKPKCLCKNKEFTKAVVEINNPEQITLMRRVVIPASMGDDTAVPPVVGKYKNVLLYYEANSKSYLYSSDGIPTLLANGVTDYEQAVNLPQINGVTLIGNKTLNEIGIKAYVFDTVADMQASTDLANGNYARTLGYYSKDDKGGAYYKISSTAPSGYYETLTSSLYAEIIIEDTMNVRQFGAKGDGTSDDTNAIQKALDSCSDIMVPTGTYMVDAVTSLSLNTGNKLSLDNNSVLECIANDATTYKIININDVDNVEICGGTIKGDRATHTGSTGEWGHCINISGNSNNIYIHDIYLKDAWGDGIYFSTSGDVFTSRVHVDNVRRNGYSVINAGKLISNDDLIENVGGDTGTAPKDGVDIEPNQDTETVWAVFNNLTTRNNTHAGFQVYHVRNNSIPTHIELNNYYNDGGNKGIILETNEAAKGEIFVDKAVIKNTTSPPGSGLMVKLGSTKYHVQITNPIIDGYAVTASSHGAIYVSAPSGATSGNLEIINPTITRPQGEVTNTTCIRFENIGGSGTYSGIKILNPLSVDNKNFTLNGSYSNTIIRDDYNSISVDQNSALNIGSGAYYSLVTSSTYSADRNVTIKNTSTIPTGSRIKFMNTGSYKMNIIFEDQYIYPLSSVTGTTVTLNDKGDMVEIERLSSTEWSVINNVGNVTTT